MAQPRVLLTGFGPFPGVAENPSARLVETLACAKNFVPRGCELRAQVLPTEWGAVENIVPTLLDSLEPHVTIHFGVSEQAQSLRIERRARNATLRSPDAAGTLPARRRIHLGGPAGLDSTVSARRVAAMLRKGCVPAMTSADAGSYLCNFIYYHSLSWALSRHNPHAVLFVHIPLARADGGPIEDADLLRGVAMILDFLLGAADEFPNRSKDVPVASRGQR